MGSFRRNKRKNKTKMGISRK
ncbi:hypothetical protein CY0110_17597 [Crocosphaera chwakensis CCY0110]|uniref:Uncharacterized protein n=1 Tax=Crocosphaera chwakensis CCY0110 TaxID=391612 RepID=A3IIK1_9CHRO|nr:hypothetical protein CY0110_17597 [Crocosphaera chwakensis CCY0110]